LTFSVENLQYPVSDKQLDDARRIVAHASSWILTDGKTGDIINCVGVAERLALQPEMRLVRPRKFFAMMMPYGPIDPAESPGKPGSPIAPPYPDIAIGSGRRALAYLKRIKKESRNRTLTVLLKAGRVSASAADLIWVPQHDTLRGPNVLVTLTSPHNITEKRLADAKVNPPFKLRRGTPTVGVLLGGTSRHHHFTAGNIAALTKKLADIAASGAMLLVSPSRRTPPELAEAVQAICVANGGYYWDGSDPNPYTAILASADYLIVTEDSVNMMGEAISTGKPVHLFIPSGGHTKISSFVKGITDHGAVRELGEHLENWSYTSLDATPMIAVALAQAFKHHRASKT
jgi:uncharacterized protein